MSREKDIAAQLTALGVYDPAFDPEIHTLCIMERELSRADGHPAGRTQRNVRRAQGTVP